jgi:hypothetical protein
MLLNLSNHPVKNWSEKQIAAAHKKFSKVEDLPFPQIDPNASETDIEKLAKEYFNICNDKLLHFPNENNAVHIMGELTFTFALVKKLLENNIVCVASTTERNAIETDGKKISEFKFIKFRKYV